MITITATTTGAFAICDLLRVDFSPEASVTEHPVELGAEVTDHVQTRPLRFTAEVFVSDSPRLASLVTLRNTRAATLFFESLLGQLCNVVIADEGTFTSFVLEGCPHARSAQLGRTYSLRFRQVRIALAVSVLIPARLPAPIAAVGAPTEVDTGQQAAGAAGAAPVDVSTLAAIAGL